MTASSALELLGQAVRIKEDMEAREKELRKLGRDVPRLLAESEATSRHSRTRAGYSAAMVGHDRFIDQMLDLSGNASSLGEQFRLDRYQAQIGEVHTS